MRKLYLSRDNKIIAGVCGGFAEFFKVDATLIRIIWVMLTLMSFFTLIIVYVICWAVMPLRRD